MTEPKMVSNCCGASYFSSYLTLEERFNRGVGGNPIVWRCDKCHKPCKVKEERDDY